MTLCLLTDREHPRYLCFALPDIIQFVTPQLFTHTPDIELHARNINSMDVQLSVGSNGSSSSLKLEHFEDKMAPTIFQRINSSLKNGFDEEETTQSQDLLVVG